MSNLSDSQMLDPLREVPKPHKGESRRAEQAKHMINTRRGKVGDSAEQASTNVFAIQSKKSPTAWALL
ncbi:hypothetical protein HZ326_15894 [Fusarium oxysporum f. sp. albedinis]|nr:hypothetical protein HZ326_15894 [Fusarium oxysporum f. sp. albedinis]